jgi:hypothetical protein
MGKKKGKEERDAESHRKIIETVTEIVKKDTRELKRSNKERER